MISVRKLHKMLDKVTNPTLKAAALQGRLTNHNGECLVPIKFLGIVIGYTLEKVQTSEKQFHSI